MIKITDEFYIGGTIHCYELKKKMIIEDEKSKNKGKIQYKDIGFYGTLESCLDGFVKYKTREFLATEQEQSLKDLKKEITKLEKIIKSLNIDKGEN